MAVIPLAVFSRKIQGTVLEARSSASSPPASFPKPVSMHDAILQLSPRPFFGLGDLSSL